MTLVFKQPVQFDWDTGNIVKNLLKHGVSSLECEEVFGDEYKVVFADTKHSRAERRHIVIGQTKEERRLYVVFTIRRKNVRVISARDLNERSLFSLLVSGRNDKRRLTIMKKELKVPKFRNESEEFEFWAKLNLNDYFDEQDFVPAVFPNLKPSSSSISIRLPDYLLSHIKASANQQDVPYQSLIKQTLIRQFASSDANC